MRYPVALVAALGIVVGSASGAAAAGSSLQTSHQVRVPSGYVLVVTEESEDEVVLDEYEYTEEEEYVEVDTEFVYEESDEYVAEDGDYVAEDDEYAAEEYDEDGVAIDEQKGKPDNTGKPEEKPDQCKGKPYNCRPDGKPKPTPTTPSCPDKPGKPGGCTGKPDKPNRPSPTKPTPTKPGTKHPVTGAALALYGVGGALLTAVGGTVMVDQKRRKVERA